MKCHKELAFYPKGSAKQKKFQKKSWAEAQIHGIEEVRKAYPEDGSTARLQTVSNCNDVVSLYVKEVKAKFDKLLEEKDEADCR